MSKLEIQSGSYQLSKDSYPEITIGVFGTTIDNGIHGKRTLSPRDIFVEVDNLATLVSIDKLVAAYHELQLVIEGPK